MYTFKYTFSSNTPTNKVTNVSPIRKKKMLTRFNGACQNLPRSCWWTETILGHNFIHTIVGDLRDPCCCSAGTFFPLLMVKHQCRDCQATTSKAVCSQSRGTYYEIRIMLDYLWVRYLMFTLRGPCHCQYIYTVYTDTLGNHWHQH